MEERWLAVRTIAAAGSGLQWLRETCFREVDDAEWQAVLRRASRHMAAAEMPRCRPTFSGERAAIEQPDGAAFSGLRLGTTREQLVAGLMRALAAESEESYRRLARIRRPSATVHISGGASVLADAMHAAWPRRHRFVRMKGETLRGLVELAEAALEGTPGSHKQMP
jgi:glycerol kinase